MASLVRRKWFWHVVAVLAVALLFCLPAIWNGYPLIYYDTEDYVNMAFTWNPPLWRTMPYALVTVLGRPFGTLWVVVAVQGLVNAWILHELVCAFLPRRQLTVFAILGVVLTLFTGMPWIASMIMPDAWAGIVPLGIATLAYGRGLSLWRRLVVGFFVGLAVVTHMSHLAVAAGLLLVVLVLWLLAPRVRRWSRPALGMVAGSVMLATAAVPLIHGIATGSYFFTRAGSVLQLALFVQNGLAKRYLDEVCPKGATLKLCPYRDKFPDSADAFLWAPWASPFWDLGGWGAMKKEANVIVAGVIRRYPGALAAAAVANTAEQLTSVGVGDGMGPKRRPGWGGYYYDTAQKRYPQEFAAYIGARQEVGDGIDFDPLNDYQIPFALAAEAALLLLTGFLLWGGDGDAAGLGIVMVLALLGNAFVCGAISNPHDRYQNRLIPAAVAIVGVALVRRRLARRAAEAGEAGGGTGPFVFVQAGRAPAVAGGLADGRPAPTMVLDGSDAGR